MIKFTLPLRVRRSKKKMFSLNTNQYRNLHYQTLNKCKREFEQIFEENHGHSAGPPLEKCQLKYTIFWPDNRAADLGNVGAIVDKFTADCLTKFGYITDDNREVVKRISFEDGGIDRENPRVELELIEMENK